MLQNIFFVGIDYKLNFNIIIFYFSRTTLMKQLLYWKILVNLSINLVL